MRYCSLSKPSSLLRPLYGSNKGSSCGSTRAVTMVESYIELNQNKRALAVNELEKNFFKLMNTAVFGKCMEDVHKRIHVDIVHDKKLFKKRVAKITFTFTRSQKIRKDLHAGKMYNVTTLLNKPITVGFAILKLSKTLMYKVHYKHMKVMYLGNRLTH